MRVAIIDYQAGNVRSMMLALARLGVHATITHQAEEILTADRIIFPGVGAAGSAMNSLRQLGLIEVIRQIKQPFLGVCLGMQLLCSYSAEDDTDCLGIIPVSVKKFEANPQLRVPHMGWNEVNFANHALFKGLTSGTYFYFVHSYYAAIDELHTIATCEHGIAFSAGLQKDNFMGVQFHPEKSADAGLKILENFLTSEWK